MKKYLFFCIAALTLVNACGNSGEPIEQNFTVPSWTLYKRALQSGQTVNEAEALLVPKDYPYNINTTFNGDPSTRMGIAWFTNANVTGGVVQIIEGRANNVSAFAKAREIPAVYVAVDTVNYVSIGRINPNTNLYTNTNDGLINATGFSKGEKRSYTSNKALIDNLKPNTVYSYRVGKKGAWSEMGTFTTASGNKEAFEFIYVTDTQANTDEMFDISKNTIEAAYRQLPDAKFLLITGDLVESERIQSSEWEWEQWFEKMRNVWLRLPIAPAQGNHDYSPFNHMFHHFNTDVTFNSLQSSDDARTTIDGTVYSFVYGDALFLVVNYEDFAKGEPYFSALEKWIRMQVNANSSVKWRIAAFHKAMFTGSSSHQNEREGREQNGKIVRDRFASVFQDVGIDVALQGHDHVYEVIGVIKAEGTTYAHLPDAVTGQEFAEPTFADGTIPSANVTGKSGGTFNVSNGMIYFLNNSAGAKKYYPRSKKEMEEAKHLHGVGNYFNMFNRFGQTDEPTFSHVKVSTDAIEIATYTVDNSGKTTLFDAFSVVK